MYNSKIVFQGYKIASRHFRTVDEVSYLLVETPVMGTRQHRRMIGANPIQTSLYSRPLLYADSYPSSADESNHVYCSHRVDSVEFFRILDSFLLDQLSDFPEFRDRAFQLTISKAGKLEELSVTLPFVPSLNLDQLPLVSEQIEFVRCYIPFGDVTVSFGRPNSSENELDCAQKGWLNASLETPLLGCDMTKSTILIPLMARLHWASGTLSESTLEHLIGQLSFNPVAA